VDGAGTGGAAGADFDGAGCARAATIFCGGGFADLAVTVVDAALREREGAAAVAGFGVEFVKRGNFLLRR